MPRDIALNQALARSVRLDLFRHSLVQDLPFTDEPVPTPEDEIADLRRTGIIPTRRQEAEEDVRAQQRRARRLELTGGTREYSVDSSNAIATGVSQVISPVFEPGRIRAVLVNFNCDAGTGEGRIFLAVKWTPGAIGLLDPLSIDTYDAANQIWEQNRTIDAAGRQYQMAFLTIANQNQSWMSDVNFPITTVPFTLLARFRHDQSVAGTLEVHTNITVIFDPEPDLATTRIFIPPIGRLSINRSTRPVAPRTPRARFPRAVKISVFSDGRIINQRTISWVSASANIKRKFFNERDAGEAPAAGIQWIF
ncbi:MAG: hypothetical protein ACE5KQ_04715 [Thermoplasmata archaeon]